MNERMQKQFGTGQVNQIGQVIIEKQDQSQGILKQGNNVDVNQIGNLKSSLADDQIVEKNEDAV